MAADWEKGLLQGWLGEVESGEQVHVSHVTSEEVWGHLVDR